MNHEASRPDERVGELSFFLFQPGRADGIGAVTRYGVNRHSDLGERVGQILRDRRTIGIGGQGRIDCVVGSPDRVPGIRRQPTREIAQPAGQSF
jgi:hypothetical protein